MKYLVAALLAISLVGCASTVIGMPQNGIITSDLPDVGDFAYVKATFPNKEVDPAKSGFVTYEFVGKVIDHQLKLKLIDDGDGNGHIEGFHIYAVEYNGVNYFIGTGGADVVKKVALPGTTTKSTEEAPFDGFTPDGALKPSDPERGSQKP